jgi:hypothetical protein
MNTELSQLRMRLREASELLKGTGEHFWAAWLDESLAQLERDVRGGVEHLLKAYGGMGSFNDLVLNVAESDANPWPQLSSLDTRFNNLRTELFEMAQRLQKTGHRSD